jgi:sucrose-6F-phosphate phosphohydrolase
MKYLLICDLDDTLIGEKSGVRNFNKVAISKKFHMVYSSGRFKDSMVSLITKVGLVYPDVLIANLGTELYYAPHWTKDLNWEQRIEKNWNKEKIAEILEDFDLQPQPHNKAFVLPYYSDDQSVVREIRKKMDHCNAKVVHTKNHFLDIIPDLAGKGNAAKYVGCLLDLPIVCCGDSENDEEMLKKSDYGILVGNAPYSLKKAMSEYSHVYIAKLNHAMGVIEGLIHYGFIS